MSSNILVTGAAGYIGGSLVADLLASKNPLFKNANIYATVRSDDQAKALSNAGINVLQLNLTDEHAVQEGVLKHDINIVVQTASSIDPATSLPLITALGKQKAASGKATHFIHTSGLSAFLEKTGWPHGQFKDTGPVFDIEKNFQDSFPLRKTDVNVTEYAEAQGVASYIVIPPHVYGKGTGAWNQLSVSIPIFIKGCITAKQVYKFPQDTKVSAVHISDLTALYTQLLENILDKKTIPNGKEGYYFALAHAMQWWEYGEHMAIALKARGLVKDTTTPVWPSDEVASEKLNVPMPFLVPFWNAGEDIVIEKPYQIGWKPQWDHEKFLKRIDDDIDAVLELGEAKSSLMDSLRGLGK